MSRTPEPQAVQAGDVIAGKFRLERVIGQGGMGSVWAARHLQLDMPVAVKFIDAAADAADARTRFEREARAAGQLRSPHVVQMIDHGIDGDRPYIAMELLEGEDLGERLRREGRIPVASAARILTQASKALRRAHEAGIIHRDLKPSNIFLARFDDDEMVKLLDFGVAKLRVHGAIDGSQATQTGVVFGSPSYMSPEQARGVRVLDHRSDLWSMAVILFRAITGVKPFSAASIGDLVIKLCIDPLPIPSAVAPDLPKSVDVFFERAFARDPDKRFQSAIELAAAFEAAVASPEARAAASAQPPPSSSGPYAMVSSTVTVTQPLASSVAATPVPPPPAPAHPFAPIARAQGPAQAVLPGAPVPPGSGPIVAFAPGTLTPPSGGLPAADHTPASGAFLASPAVPSAPALPQPATWGSPQGNTGRFDVTGSSTALLRPDVSPPRGTAISESALSAQAAMQAPSEVAPYAPQRPRAAVSAPPNKLVVGAAIGVTAIAVLILAIIGATRRRGDDTASAASAAASASARSAAQQPIEAPAPSPPAPEPPAPAASATSSATIEDQPPAEATAAGAPSADPSAAAADSSAKAAPGKPGKKKKPNFGY